MYTSHIHTTYRALGSHIVKWKWMKVILKHFKIPSIHLMSQDLPSSTSTQSDPVWLNVVQAVITCSPAGAVGVCGWLWVGGPVQTPEGSPLPRERRAREEPRAQPATGLPQPAGTRSRPVATTTPITAGGSTHRTSSPRTHRALKSNVSFSNFCKLQPLFCEDYRHVSRATLASDSKILWKNPIGFL